MTEYIVNGYPVREIKAYTAKTGYNKAGENTFIYNTPEGRLYIDYELQSTGYGQKPLLICPICHNRHSKLYHAGYTVFCRTCQPKINPYKGIQYSTKGGSDYIAYAMKNLAKKYGVDYFSIRDFTGDWIITDYRPSYMRKATFADMVGRLSELDELRCISILRRFTNTESKIDTELIRGICTAPPIELMELDFYRDTIELAEEVYRLPIKERLLASGK